MGIAQRKSPDCFQSGLLLFGGDNLPYDDPGRDECAQPVDDQRRIRKGRPGCTTIEGPGAGVTPLATATPVQSAATGANVWLSEVDL